MKNACRQLLFFIYCIQLTISLSAQDNKPVWEKKSDFKGGKLQGAVSFTIGEKNYVCLGSDGNQYKKDCWEYDYKTDTWKKLSNFPGDPRILAVVFTIGDKGYVGTGQVDSKDGNTGKKDFWEYNPVTDIWLQKADLPADARYGAIGFSIGDKGYVGLGATADKIKYCNDLWEYNPKDNQWSNKAVFPDNGRVGASAFVINNSAYVLFGGVSSDLIGVTNKDVWEYNPLKNKWQKQVDFPGVARQGAIAFSVNNKGYVCSGNNGFMKYYNDFWEYNTKQNVWKQKPNINFDARYDAISFVINNAVYVGTGNVKKALGGSSSSDMWYSNLKAAIVSVDYNAKLLYEDKNKKLPLAKQGVSLIGEEKNVIQKTTTDNSGLFAFKQIDIDGKYHVVLDKNDKLPADATVAIAKPNGKIIKNLEKNANGQFFYEVPKLELIEEDDSYFNLQYFMKSSDKETTITANIYYPAGSAELSKEAKDILYQVIVSLNQFPDLIVSISSLTDSRGDDASNLQLSERRAKTVVDYIISNEIDPKRVSGKGFGETKILNKCKNGIECTEEEHKVNRRTEFKFIKPN